jgi:integrase
LRSFGDGRSPCGGQRSVDARRDWAVAEGGVGAELLARVDSSQSERQGGHTQNAKAEVRERPWAPAGVRIQLHDTARRAGVRRRFAPHQLRHAHAVEMSREGVPLLVIQRQLGHANLAITSVYLRGIDNTEIVHTVHERPAPTIPAHNGLHCL